MDGYGLGYIYIFFSDFGRATDIMFLVGWLPDPPDQINIHIKNKIKPLSPLSLSLSFSFLTLSPQLLSHNLTGSPSFSPSFTLSFLSLFHCHKLNKSCSGAASSSSARSKLSLLSLDVCLGKNSPSSGGSRSGETSLDLVRSRQI